MRHARTSLVLLGVLAWASCGFVDELPKAARLQCAAPGDCPGAQACDIDNGLCVSASDACHTVRGRSAVRRSDGAQCDAGICIAGSCAARRCGDGIRSEPEACDDGNTDDSDACTSSCATAACGDGAQQLGEACDDGNTESGDGCSGDCQKREVCGDAIIDVGEACDDANTNPADVCDDCHAVDWLSTSLLRGVPVAQSGDIAQFTIAENGDVIIASGSAHRVMRLSTTVAPVVVAGTGTTGFSGDGAPASIASLAAPQGVVIDGLGRVAIADTGNCRVRRVDVDGVMRTIAGVGCDTGDFALSGGVATDVRVEPQRIGIDAAGALYFAEELCGVRRLRNDVIEPVVGSGVCGVTTEATAAAQADVGRVGLIAVADDGRFAFVADVGLPWASLYLFDGTSVSLLAGRGQLAPVPGVRGRDAQLQGIVDLALADDQLAIAVVGEVLLLDLNGSVAFFSPPAGLSQPYRVTAHNDQLFSLNSLLTLQNIDQSEPGQQLLLGEPASNDDVLRMARGDFFLASSLADGRSVVGSGGMFVQQGDRLEQVVPADMFSGVSFAATGDDVWFTDLFGTIRSWSSLTGVVSGGGEHGFARALSLAVRDDVVVAGDFGFIRRYRPGQAEEVLAGDGTVGDSGDGGSATLAQVGNQLSLAIGPDGAVWIADFAVGSLRRVLNGQIDSMYRVPGVRVTHVVVRDDGRVWFVDGAQQRLMQWQAPDVAVTVGAGSDAYAGDTGQLANARFRAVESISSNGGDVTVVEVAPGGLAHYARRITAVDEIETVVGPVDPDTNGAFDRASVPGVVDWAAVDGEKLLAATEAGRVVLMDFATARTSVIAGFDAELLPAPTTRARFSVLGALTAIESIDAERTVLANAAGQLFMLSTPDFARPEDFTVQTLAWSFASVGGLAFDNEQQRIFVADTAMHCVQVIDLDDDSVADFAGRCGIAGNAGDDGPATLALLHAPTALAWAQTGELYIAERDASRVRVVNTDGTLRHVIGDGSASTAGEGQPARAFAVKSPSGLSLDAFGNLFIACGDAIRVVADANDDAHADGDDAVLNIAGARHNAGDAANARCLATVLVDGAFALAADACTGAVYELSRQ